MGGLTRAAGLPRAGPGLCGAPRAGPGLCGAPRAGPGLRGALRAGPGLCGTPRVLCGGLTIIGAALTATLLWILVSALVEFEAIVARLGTGTVALPTRSVGSW
mmetsp:Transcript_71928/g.131269  ORF Transcript_71928/g.131269 Transcript_71928/m.131269 type:complete len:103 (-) Transcript_71928:214-522(-)